MFPSKFGHSPSGTSIEHHEFNVVPKTLIVLGVEGTDLQSFYLFSALLYVQPVALQTFLSQSLRCKQKHREPGAFLTF